MGALTEVAAAAGPYPTRLLERERSALLLFGAAYLGANDGYHIREAGMYATVVDTDDQRLAEMFEVYPATWTFVPEDAYLYAERCESQSFDVVSVDCFTGDASALCVKLAPEWTRIARHAVTVTVAPADVVGFVSPDGWRASLMRRTPLASWLVLERK
jgi:hypothetical protein